LVTDCRAFHIPPLEINRDSVCDDANRISLYVEHVHHAELDPGELGVGARRAQRGLRELAPVSFISETHLNVEERLPVEQRCRAVARPCVFSAMRPASPCRARRSVRITLLVVVVKARNSRLSVLLIRRHARTSPRRRNLAPAESPIQCGSGRNTRCGSRHCHTQ